MVQGQTDCCCSPASDVAHPRKRRCPQCRGEHAEVAARTIAHHIAHPWNWSDQGLRYFFCETPECDVVYFGEDDSVILKSRLRSKVSAKETAGDTPVCYCFGVTRADVQSNPGIRDYVVSQTKRGLCSCDSSNPSGRCCLKDFPHDHEAE